MRRDEAIEILCDGVGENDLLVFANGKISREGYLRRDSKRNFYMLASMGKAASIGLGLALCMPEKHVVVIDGDGNALMNLDNFAMVGYLKPKNFVHVVLDNEEYATTGGQETLTTTIDLAEIAQASGYASVATVQTAQDLQEAIARKEDPSFVLVKVVKEQLEGTKIIPYSPEEIKNRFIEYVKHI
jgi:sulfopyruvate decarboxylase subunit beta